MGKKEKPYQKYVGTKFGKLTILEIKAGSYIAGKRIVRTKARCKCDCGFIKDINWDHLKSGAINSCGCSRDSNVYIGQKFGNFIVLEIIPHHYNKQGTRNLTLLIAEIPCL